MTRILKPVAIAALVLTILPAFLLLGGAISEGTTKVIMLVGMVLWYATATPWLGLSKD